MPEYHETKLDRIDRIMKDWVFPLGILALLIFIVDIIVRNI